jgi:hypothetical protein
MVFQQDEAWAARSLHAAFASTWHEYRRVHLVRQDSLRFADAGSQRGTLAERGGLRAL